MINARTIPLIPFITTINSYSMTKTRIQIPKKVPCSMPTLPPPLRAELDLPGSAGRDMAAYTVQAFSMATRRRLERLVMPPKADKGIAFQRPKHRIARLDRQQFTDLLQGLEVLHAEKLTPGDVTYCIAHQANKRILDATLERLEIPASKCWMNLEKYGNTSAASVPMTLDEANRAGWFKPGDVILMMAIGGGMAWGASVVRW